MSTRRVWSVAVSMLALACVDCGKDASTSSTSNGTPGMTEDAGQDAGSSSFDAGQTDAASSGDLGDNDAGTAPPCGDKLVSAPETCDDGNAQAKDGCDDKCQIEPGYACPVVGALCRAKACGDGIIAGDEECEDGNIKPSDGCSDRCRLEPGFACDEVGKPCHATVCGDKKPEGSEQCDDGNATPYDGCFACQFEPDCGLDGCKARCGDGIKFPGEECDDGNVRSGDGCSKTCTREPGFTCDEQTQELPAYVEIPIILRDFRGNDLPAIPSAGLAAGHPDFENKNGDEDGLVKVELSADKKPVYAKADGASSTTQSAAMFDKWYRNDPAYNLAVIDKVRLDRGKDANYVFRDDFFFPLDARGFVAQGNEPLRDGAKDDMGVSKHNFSFTSELRTWFEYQGGEYLEFLGDDDVWVFVNGRRAVDLGGVHSAKMGSVTLDASGSDTRFAIKKGNIYELVVFQAERHTSESKYQLTLRSFVRAKTTCKSICGDGVLTPDEACDDGKNLGGYGQCAPGCVLGPRCGDTVVQADQGEECDDGNRVDQDGCSNACIINTIQ